jgi:hypothetical protein
MLARPVVRDGGGSSSIPLRKPESRTGSADASNFAPLAPAHGLVRRVALGYTEPPVTTLRTPRRAAVYVRVSTEKQTSENQVAEVWQLATARGFEPVLYEEVESAAKVRPVLDRMLADVRAGRVHAVAVWALDRLHRSMVGAIQTVLELDRLGVPVLSVREGLARHERACAPPPCRHLRLGRGAGTHSPHRADEGGLGARSA